MYPEEESEETGGIMQEKEQPNNAGNTTDVGVGGNKDHKDTLFRKIFGSEEHKKYLLSLYNAINGSDYTNSDELEIMTMEDVLYVSMKNDVAFLFSSEMNLFEHQSTLNLNMPVRGFLYAAKLWQKWLAKNQKNFYKKELVKLPTPRYTVFYNGLEKAEDKSELRLSDAFMVPPKEGTFEWTATMYNINFGRNKELMEKCEALREYADFVRMVRENYKKCKDSTKAIKEAMEEAIRKNYLGGYFKKEKENVFMTVLQEVDRAVYENDLREEGKKEGREEGREEEREEGIQIMVSTLLELDTEYNVILNKLETKYQLSPEKAEGYIEKGILKSGIDTRANQGPKR